MEGRWFLAWMLVPAALVSPTSTGAQDLLKDALTSFPPQTIRVEYSHLAKLRTLPNYASLRQRFVGPRLQVLETSLSQLGIQERDIDELVLGWHPSGTAIEFEGLAGGRFDSQAIADRAAAQGLSAMPAADLKAYCLEARSAANCVVVLSTSRGAFGTLASLSAIVDASQGRAASLASDDRFMKLLSAARKEASIWGVATGPAVADWFQSWMRDQKGLQLDWGHAFQTVEALTYSVEAAESVQLDVQLDCTSPEAATSLRQVLEGLKLIQQLAWQNQNPNRPNPFQALGVEANGRQVFLKMTTAYAALEGVWAPGLR